MCARIAAAGSARRRASGSIGYASANHWWWSVSDNEAYGPEPLADLARILGHVVGRCDTEKG